MNRRLVLSCFAASLLTCSLSASAGKERASITSQMAATAAPTTAPAATPDALTRLAERALADDPATAGAAITRLRAAGPAGLEALFRVHARILAAGPDDRLASRLSAAIDRVAAQRDARASRLYWYTDLARAEAAARASGKPILSLRLLGRLDEEMSCANSRLFRSVLYANHEVAATLRERYILHWQSVRPVPKVRVDFGDGRVLERTLTGNSIHYVLDAEGRPVEAIPGLWGPQAFMAELERAEAMVRQLSSLNAPERALELRRYHARQATEIDRVLTAFASESGISIGASAEARAPESDSGRQREAGLLTPSAIRAGRETTSKMMVERPLLTTLSLPELSVVNENEAFLWSRLGERERPTVQLDQGTRELIASKLLPVRDGYVPVEPPRSDRLARTLERLRSTIAQDQARNRYCIQRAIHQWFADDVVADDLEQLNQRVYAQLFLTPDSDPWLGLAPDDVYSAIAGEGMRVAPTQAR